MKKPVAMLVTSFPKLSFINFRSASILAFVTTGAALFAPYALFPKYVTVETYLGNNAYGANKAAPVVTKARIEAERKLIKDNLGNEVTSIATGFFMPEDESILLPESVVTYGIHTYT